MTTKRDTCDKCFGKAGKGATAIPRQDIQNIPEDFPYKTVLFCKKCYTFEVFKDAPEWMKVKYGSGAR